VRFRHEAVSRAIELTLPLQCPTGTTDALHRSS
jgi:hypothetical protein